MAMTDLRAELDEVLQAVDPGQAPVEAAMRQGRRLRSRRRVVTVASAVAVAVAVAAGYPALSQDSALPRKPAAPAPSAPQDQVITVTPGPGGPSGVIAVGTIGGTRWRLSISDSFAGGCISGTVGTQDIATGCYQSGMLFPAAPGTPLGLQGSSNDNYTMAAGVVAANVQYVVCTLIDGQQLKLIPVALGGHRYVAYATPAGVWVTRATAYLDNGQELTAVPFLTSGFAIPLFVRWVAPGQREQPRVTAVIGSGRTDGQPWSVTASIGPWGTCLQGEISGAPSGGTGASCWPSTQITSTQADGILDDGQGYPLSMLVGSAAPAVTKVKVTLTDGTIVWVPARAAGSEKFWALALSQPQSVRDWAAYDAAGKQVAAGQGAG
jgi:hypothetical protein